MSTTAADQRALFARRRGPRRPRADASTSGACARTTDGWSACRASRPRPRSASSRCCPRSTTSCSNTRQVIDMGEPRPNARTDHRLQHRRGLHCFPAGAYWHPIGTRARKRPPSSADGASWKARKRLRRGETSRKRLKGLEPSTFCMASSSSWPVSRTFYLQIARFRALGCRWDSSRFVAFCRGSVNQSSTRA